ncbi:MAG TPA: winged helix-turn-helix domain-containing protein, partial [Longimicrobiales bacterium]|nr:winged helix-turn-helix domain-containing protein [Longimicrobiales bacterium]
MKPLLTQVFASAARARLLQLLAIFHDEPLRFCDMQRRLGVGSRSLQRELSLLTELGLVTKEGRGGEVRYRA